MLGKEKQPCKNIGSPNLEGPVPGVVEIYHLWFMGFWGLFPCQPLACWSISIRPAYLALTGWLVM